MTSESAKKHFNNRKQNIYNILIYYKSCIIWFFAIGTVVSFSGVVSPKNTYITCDDISLSHGFNKDSISTTVLLLISLLGPLLQMTITEWISDVKKASESSSLSKGLRRSYSLFLSLCAGCLFTFFVIEVLKTAVSAPRPHFMNSCKPNLTQVMCQTQWVHLTYENCTNPMNLSFFKLIDTMKSFPSGHAAIGFYSATFMTIYIQKRVRVSWSSLFAAWLQLVWITWGFLCCFSRVWDSKHHWRDVCFGAIFGALTGYATVAYLCFGFDRKKTSDLAETMKATGQDLKILSSIECEENQGRNFHRERAELNEESRVIS